MFVVIGNATLETELGHQHTMWRSGGVSPHWRVQSEALGLGKESTGQVLSVFLSLTSVRLETAQGPGPGKVWRLTRAQDDALLRGAWCLSLHL